MATCNKAAYRWYVYQLIDPRDESVFYVGKGQGNRIAAHESQAAKKVCSRKTKRIKDIWESGRDVIRKQVAFFNDEACAYDFETDLIDEIGLSNLTNMLPGGEGAWSKRLSERKVRKAKESIRVDLPALVDRMAYIVRTSNGLKDEYTVIFSGETPALSSFRNTLSKMVLNRFGGYVGFARHVIADMVKCFGSDVVRNEFAKHNIDMRFA